MKYIIMEFIFCLMLFSQLGQIAQAGYTVHNDTVFVQAPTSTANGYAYGSISSARYSSDSVEEIGCTLTNNGPSVSSPSIQCYAVDSLNHYLGCISSNPAYTTVVTSISSISYIYFQADINRNCTYLYVDNGSYSLW